MKVKRKAIVILLSVFALAACAFIAFKPDNKVMAAKVAFPENEIKDEYYLNQEISLPSEVKVSYDGEEYELTESALVYPDGNAYGKQTYTLDLYGEYKAVYSLKTRNLILSAEKSFSVINKNFGVSSEYSSAEYAELTSEFAKATGKTNGIKISLASGDTFGYNVPVNVNDFGEDGFITLYTPQLPDAADVGNIVVRLTDCYDSSVYIDFLLWYEAKSSVHARAGASGQALSGLNKNPRVSATGTPIYIDGEEWYAATSRYGAVLGHSSGATAPAGFTWRYNALTGDVYITNRSGDYVRVTQLCNADIYGKNTFGGFTTGEVYLSVYAENYNESAARIEISQICGVSSEGLTVTDYKDETAPVLSIDERVPKSGIVYCAKGETIPIFEATATDVSKATVSASVYFNYESSKRSIVFVKDGKFVAKRPGAYTIVYTAADFYGNQTVKTVTVNCVQTQSGKAIDFSVDKLSRLKAGYAVTLPEYAVNGLNGEVTVDISAVYGGEETKIENGEFLPLKVGTYEIKYRYYDNINSYEFSYEVESVASDAVKFLDKASAPRYFIKGAEYSLDELKAYAFTGKENDYAATEFFVKYDDGEYVKTDVKSFKVTGNEKARIKYVSGNEVIESGEIKIVDVGFNGKFDMSAYFQGDFTADSTANRIRYTANNTSGNGELQFINALSFSNFRLDFTIPAGAYYKAFTIRLTDCYDSNNAIIVKLYNIIGGLGAAVNGEAYKSSGSFADNAIKTLRYDNSNKKLILPGDTAVPLENTFTKDLFFLDVICEDINGEAYFEVTTVNNQPFTTTYFDVIEPLVSFTDRSGRYDLNEKITLEPAYYTDVISPSVYGKLTIEVTDPSDNYVVSDEGIRLDGTVLATEKYTISLNAYGNYRVNYRAEDQSGNVTNLPCVINVEDAVKPTVTIKESVVKMKVLTVVRLDNYTVSDNLTAAEKLSVTVIVTDKKQNSVIFVGEEFAARYAGTYTVYVYCSDEAGNVGVASYTLIVG